MVYLSYHEYQKFKEVYTTSEMTADINSDSSHLSVNIDMILHDVPCHIVSLDVQDIMGTHSSKFDSQLKKYRTNQSKQMIGEYTEPKSDDSLNTSQPQLEEVKNALKDQEGCWLIGQISVLRVPGSVYLSYFQYAYIINRLRAEGIKLPDFSHTINHISFGEEEDLKVIKTIFDTGILNPIDGTVKDHKNKKEQDEYYLNVVPTTYVDLEGKSYKVHQFVSNSNVVPLGNTLQALYIRFDISPIMVKYTMHRERIHYFFIEICAIVGGIYSVTSIILSFILNSYYSFSKQKQK